MPRRLLPTATIFLFCTAAAHAATPPSLPDLAAQALSADTSLSTPAIAQLRAAAYPGLDALLALQPAATDAPALARWHHALDEVAQQKDAHASRLFWYTDLAAATREAQRTGKPILSLRLLGTLNTDLSCANSRFFRTTLYPAAAVNAYLREHFILHWQSVRPVPVVTINMGDGRVLTRTIAGNSIHYILDPHGRLVDALPGLYGASTFLNAVKSAEAQALATAAEDDTTFVQSEQAYAHATAAHLHDAFHADLTAIAYTGNLDALTDDAWKQLATLHPQDAQLDPAARTLIAGKVPIEKAMPTTATKCAVETPLMVMLRTLGTSIALDTVKNNYTFRPTLLSWLQQSTSPTDLPAFTTRVYADLFLTPSTDPWLGLAPVDAYAALDNGGIRQK